MAKLYATINSAEGPVELERKATSAPWSLIGEGAPDLVRTGPSSYSLVHNGRSYRVLVLKEDRENNTVRLRIGSGSYTVQLQDEQSRMMHTLGFDKAVKKVREIKAPMPGLVLNIMVKPGDVIKKNDPILVLEAMKMENLIKAPSDSIVSSVQAEQGKAVEKGQILVCFE
ncbi:MAG: acetyl-CoA carboxylase biotin carboxyl carrier protein subunit [Flavobacteriales bacterium]|nr:acetyl-CoA carboxylase biotin carboxyl carrier protein subunit [Flavobacteriales bacterium]MBK6944301.1 acetyl-CoA carboxylase biotin carboxyl carrier protein subunit [Flavobacteriales bacterium]MBK7240501.1 acetyl-CoA carboxylase biotin carboxyl carrier protein subunit [Flavobacteriales bacterium]MBK7295202.1 acetyl-CoA carboxylase biotin carboxyl carrier protein subunit [Flavobacteriales bacterium]MBK9533969.1 acetyl-CoA carboxylase biotin carboxyl carrier protein subunit [Flavobacteriales